MEKVVKKEKSRGRRINGVWVSGHDLDTHGVKEAVKRASKKIVKRTPTFDARMRSKRK